MKKLIFTTTFLAACMLTFGQQWNGPDNTTGDINRTGNVGIGTTTTPTAKLEVRGRILVKNSLPYITVQGDGTNGVTQWIDIGIALNNTNFCHFSQRGDIVLRAGGGGKDFILTNQGGGALRFGTGSWTDDQEALTIESNGNIGIGTINPTEKLTVNGKILCEEVEVIQNVLPDFVFQKYYNGSSTLKADYVMPTLEEVEAFTKANYHLPEVPSAQEVKDNGMQLKEMTTILLQKIEELTLYTIEQEKRIKALEVKLTVKQ